MPKSQKKFSDTEYRRKWLCQLLAEFKSICHWHKIFLAPPAFSITDSRTVLGTWDPAGRTISISAVLINECSWDTVINVLKHEMAHQYVHEFMGRGMELPHGPAFGAACEKLGITSPFNTATGDSPKLFIDMNQHDVDPEYNSRVAKVRKMLSLASSVNKHEATAAMNKANSFIRKFNLERLDKTSGPSAYGYAIKNTGKKRLDVIVRRIVSLMMDFFYVDVVYAELYDAGNAESYKTVEILGTMENVSFAGHVYDFLRQRIELLWDSYQQASGAPGKLRKTYILGLLQGFREKLETEEKNRPVFGKSGPGSESHRTVSSLVVARDPGLKRFTAKRFPRLRKVSYRPPGVPCPDTYSDGRSEGRKIIIHKAVEQKDGNQGRVLGR